MSLLNIFLTPGPLGRIFDSAGSAYRAAHLSERNEPWPHMAILYSPPSPTSLAKLKAELNLSSAKMAELFGSEESRTWRKYAGGERTVSAQTLFFAMALLELTPAELDRVLNRMRLAGAQIELSGSPLD